MSRIYKALHLYLKLSQNWFDKSIIQNGAKLTAWKMPLEMFLPLEILATVRTKHHFVEGCRGA